tara:strand:+ start:520 stop:1155 length:636 start_codon:yes stop_codon:yes gene_type:complete
MKTKIDIISHRGFWLCPEEKNTEKAFRNSFANGFGTETDVRDLSGRLVISHDMPTGDELSFDDFLDIYSSYKGNLPLALNVKSDGIQDLIIKSLSSREISNYFMFDMSVPDALQYKNKGIIFYSRVSELEPMEYVIDGSKGVWLDSFYDDWFSSTEIKALLDRNYEVCIVSPDLHRRSYGDVWKILKDSGCSRSLMLCTDYPIHAREYFGS